MKEKEKKKNSLFVYDRTLRELLKGLPEKFIEILTGKRGIRFIDTSLPQVKERRPDLLVELEDGSVFHLEVQTKRDVNMDFRMLEYYVALKQLEEVRDRNLIQMVLYLEEREEEGKEKREEKEEEKKGEREVVFDSGRLRFKYNVQYINDIECRPLIESEGIEDNIVAILCKIDDFSYFWERLKSKLTRLPLTKRKDYMTKLMYLARLRPGIYNILDIDLRKEVEDMPLTIDKEKDPLYRMGVEEGLQEGIEKGIGRGLKEGIRLALEVKFGEEGVIFYNKYISKIRSIERLEELKEKIKKAKRIEELEKI